MSVEVIQDPDAPVAVEILAESIEKIAEAADRMMNAGLTKRAILVLLRDQTGLGMREIERVLDALSDLTAYLQEPS